MSCKTLFKNILPQRFRTPKRDSPTYQPAHAAPATSNCPASTSPPVVSDNQALSLDNPSATALNPTILSDPGSLKEKLWNRAYDQLKSQEGDIVEAYETVLSAKLVNFYSPPNAATENRISDRNEERWKQMQELVTAGLRKTEQDANIMQKIHDGIQMVYPAKALIENAMQTCPEGAIAWVGVSCVLEILTNPVEESILNRNGIIYVVSRMEWYWELVDLLLGENSQSSSKTSGMRRILEEKLSALYQQLLLYQMKSVCRYHRSRFSVFFKDLLKLDDWAGQLDDIVKAEAAIQSDSGVLMSQDMRAKVDGILQELQTQNSQLTSLLSQIEEKKDNKDCLSALSETNPENDLQRIVYDKGGLLHDSYRWILNNPDFQRWQTDPRVRRLLITGDPGKGKTMLLCGIIEALKKDGSNRLCYFFCQATERKLSTSVAVLRGLINHLVRRYPKLLEYVRKEYDGAGQHIFTDHNAWQVVSNILMAMLKDPYLDGVFVIVDALDECTVDRPKLMSFINAMSQESHLRAKWIVSSRDWPDIINELDGRQPDVNLSLKLTDEHISGAVEQYITHKVNDLTTNKKYMSDQNTHDQVERHLRQNSGNTFLWVALVWKELNSSKVMKTDHAVKVLDKSPPGLNELYERIVDHVCDQSNNLDADQCKQVLAISCVAQRLLTLQELVPLIQNPSPGDLSEKVEQLRTIIESCGSFLHLRDNTVYFVHQSAKDFLLLQKKGKRSFDLIYPSGIASQHYDIFSSSLKALEETLRRDIYGLKDPGIRVKDITPPIQDPLATLRYCCMYWVKHLTEYLDGGPAAPALRNLQDGGIVHEFLKRNFLYWLEALSLSGNISQAVEFVRVLTSIIEPKASEDAQQLAELVKDAYRFLLYHRETIDTTPLQVYASAVVFSPERSVIRQIFQHEAPKWIKEMPAMEPTWNTCLQTLVGHQMEVRSIAFSADGRWLASASIDEPVRIWDAANGACVLTLQDERAHADEPETDEFEILFRSGKPCAVAFSADSCWLAWGCRHSIVSIWDLATGTCLHTMKGHTDSITSMAFSRDSSKIASTSCDNTARIWDATKGTCLHTLRGHTKRVWSVAFSADDRLATASKDRTVRIWDSTTGECVKILRDHNECLRSVAFSPEGRRLVSIDTNVHVWNIETGEQLLKSRWFDNDDGRPHFSVAISADSRLIAISSRSIIRFWDAEHGSLPQTLQGPKDFFGEVAFSPDSQRLVSGCVGGTVRVWDISTTLDVSTVETYTPLASVTYGTRGKLNSVFFSANGRVFATVAVPNQSIKVWSTSTGECLKTFGKDQRGPPSLSDLTFSTDNLRLALISTRGIEIWNTETGFCVQSIDNDLVNSVAFIANGEQLASASSGLIQIWDVATGNCLRTLGNHNEDYKYKGFVKASTSGQWLAYSVDDKTIKLWNMVTGNYVLPLGNHADHICSTAFSADDRQLASVSPEAFKIWDVETGTCVQIIANYFHDCAPSLSFDTNRHERLHTRSGFLDLGFPPERTPRREEATKKVCYRGYGIDISQQGTWILRDGKRLMRLPPNHVPHHDDFASFMNGSVFVWVSSLGRVFRMRVSTQEK